MQIVRRFFKTKESAVILMFTGLFLVTSIIAPSFLSYAQLINLFRTISLSLLPAMGMVFVMTCGSIDLSAGTVVGIIMIAAVFMDVYRRNSSQRSGS